MSCYQPLKRFIIGVNPSTGKTEGRIFPFDTDHVEDVGGSLVPCSTPTVFNKGSRVFRDYQEIPCGYCEGCRMAHAREPLLKTVGVEQGTREPPTSST